MLCKVTHCAGRISANVKGIHTGRYFIVPPTSTLTASTMKFVDVHDILTLHYEGSHQTLLVSGPSYTHFFPTRAGDVNYRNLIPFTKSYDGSLCLGGRWVYTQNSVPPICRTT